MPNYRRAFVPGGCWFSTVNLLERRQKLLVDHADALRSAFQDTRKNYAFDIRFLGSDQQLGKLSFYH